MGNLGDNGKKLVFYLSLIACCCFPVTIILLLSALVAREFKRWRHKRRIHAVQATAKKEKEDLEDISICPVVPGLRDLFLVRRMWQDDDLVHLDCEWGKHTENVLLLSYAYAEKRNADGQYSVKVVIHVRNTEIPESIPRSCFRMLEETWKRFPNALLWSDRMQTIALPLCEVHEVVPMSRQAMIDQMGATYMNGTTVSEAVFAFSENYLRRGWVQQEILNGALVISAVEIELPAPPLLRRIVAARSDSSTRLGLSLLVAFNSGADAAKDDWGRRNAAVELDDLALQAIDFIAGTKVRIFRTRTEPASGPELLFLYSQLGAARRGARTVLVPADFCLRLAALRADPDARTLRYRAQSTRVERLGGEQHGALGVRGGGDSGCQVFGLLPRRDIEEVMSLEVYNFRDLTTEFTHEEDRHKAIYGLIEQVQGRVVGDAEKGAYGAMMGAPHSQGFVTVRNTGVSACAVMREVFFRVHAYGPSSGAFPTLPQGRRLAKREVAWCFVGSDQHDAAVWMVLGAGCCAEQCETLVFTGSYFEFWHRQSPAETLARAGVAGGDAAAILEEVPVLSEPPKENVEISGLFDLDARHAGSAQRVSRPISGPSLIELAKRSWQAREGYFFGAQ